MSKINRISIYDVDGVLLDSSHRYKTKLTEHGERIDLEYWRENEHRCVYDVPLHMAENYQNDLNDPTCYTFIATARRMQRLDFDHIKETLGEPDCWVYRTVVHGDMSGARIKLAGIRLAMKKLDLINRELPITVYEDNIQYLKTLCDNLPNSTGIYIPSGQGH